MKYAHVRRVKSLFTNIPKQKNMLKIILLFKEIYKIPGEMTQEFLGLRMRNFQGIVFTRVRRYIEISKSALVYL